MVTYADEGLGTTSRDGEQRERRFPWSLRGYRRSAVDQHIAELERELRELDHELVELRATATLREEVANEMRRIGEETAGVLIEAHSRREAISRAAEEEAQRLVAEATAKATAITAESEARVRELEAQREAVHLERDRLLQNALAASAAIADAVQGAHQQIPAMAALDVTCVERESQQAIALELPETLDTEPTGGLEPPTAALQVRCSTS
jgi:cell division septum initiation protein DivIVA